MDMDFQCDNVARTDYENPTTSSDVDVTSEAGCSNSEAPLTPQEALRILNTPISDDVILNIELVRKLIEDWRSESDLSIPEFAKKILGTSKGRYLTLVKNPGSWETMNENGRFLFVKMYNWLKTSEDQKQQILRMDLKESGDVGNTQNLASSSSSSGFEKSQNSGEPPILEDVTTEVSENKEPDSKVDSKLLRFSPILDDENLTEVDSKSPEDSDSAHRLKTSENQKQQILKMDMKESGDVSNTQSLATLSLDNRDFLGLDESQNLDDHPIFEDVTSGSMPSTSSEPASSKNAAEDVLKILNSPFPEYVSPDVQSIIGDVEKWRKKRDVPMKTFVERILWQQHQCYVSLVEDPRAWKRLNPFLHTMVLRVYNFLKIREQKRMEVLEMDMSDDSGESMPVHPHLFAPISIDANSEFLKPMTKSSQPPLTVKEAYKLLLTPIPKNVDISTNHIIEAMEVWRLEHYVCHETIANWILGKPKPTYLKLMKLSENFHDVGIVMKDSFVKMVNFLKASERQKLEILTLNLYGGGSETVRDHQKAPEKLTKDQKTLKTPEVVIPTEVNPDDDQMTLKTSEEMTTKMESLEVKEKDQSRSKSQSHIDVKDSEDSKFYDAAFSTPKPQEPNEDLTDFDSFADFDYENSADWKFQDEKMDTTKSLEVEEIHSQKRATADSDDGDSESAEPDSEDSMFEGVEAKPEFKDSGETNKGAIEDDEASSDSDSEDSDSDSDPDDDIDFEEDSEGTMKEASEAFSPIPSDVTASESQEPIPHFDAPDSFADFDSDAPESVSNGSKFHDAPPDEDYEMSFEFKDSKVEANNDEVTSEAVDEDSDASDSEEVSSELKDSDALNRTLRDVLDTPIPDGITPNVPAILEDVEKWRKNSPWTASDITRRLFGRTTKNVYSSMLKTKCSWERKKLRGKETFVKMFNFWKMSDAQKDEILGMEQENPDEDGTSKIFLSDVEVLSFKLLNSPIPEDVTLIVKSIIKSVEEWRTSNCLRQETMAHRVYGISLTTYHRCMKLSTTDSDVLSKNVKDFIRRMYNFSNASEQQKKEILKLDLFGQSDQTMPMTWKRTTKSLEVEEIHSQKRATADSDDDDSESAEPDSEGLKFEGETSKEAIEDDEASSDLDSGDSDSDSDSAPDDDIDFEDVSEQSMKEVSEVFSPIPSDVTASESQKPNHDSFADFDDMDSDAPDSVASGLKFHGASPDEDYEVSLEFKDLKVEANKDDVTSEAVDVSSGSKDTSTFNRTTLDTPIPDDVTLDVPAILEDVKKWRENSSWTVPEFSRQVLDRSRQGYFLIMSERYSWDQKKFREKPLFVKIFNFWKMSEAEKHAILHMEPEVFVEKTKIFESIEAALEMLNAPIPEDVSVPVESIIKSVEEWRAENHLSQETFAPRVLGISLSTYYRYTKTSTDYEGLSIGVKVFIGRMFNFLKASEEQKKELLALNLYGDRDWSETVRDHQKAPEELRKDEKMLRTSEVVLPAEGTPDDDQKTEKNSWRSATIQAVLYDEEDLKLYSETKNLPDEDFEIQEKSEGGPMEASKEDKAADEDADVSDSEKVSSEAKDFENPSKTSREALDTLLPSEVTPHQMTLKTSEELTPKIENLEVEDQSSSKSQFRMDVTESEDSEFHETDASPDEDSKVTSESKESENPAAPFLDDVDFRALESPQPIVDLDAPSLLNDVNNDQILEENLIRKVSDPLKSTISEEENVDSEVRQVLERLIFEVSEFNLEYTVPIESGDSPESPPIVNDEDSEAPLPASEAPENPDKTSSKSESPSRLQNEDSNSSTESKSDVDVLFEEEETPEDNEELHEDNYHPSYDINYRAKIPVVMSNEKVEKEKDRDVAENLIFGDTVTEEDMEHLKKELEHLPLETILKLLSTHQNNISKTILAGKQMRIPNLMKSPAQAIFKGCLKDERHSEVPIRHGKIPFYLKDMFKNCADTKTLVNFYYEQKVKVDREVKNSSTSSEPPKCPKIPEDLKAKMEASGIRTISGGKFKKPRGGKKSIKKTLGFESTPSTSSGAPKRGREDPEEQEEPQKKISRRK